MPWMSCPPGDSFQTLQGDRYSDVAGEGIILVEDRHLFDALHFARWKLAEPASTEEPIDAALDRLEAGIAAEDEKVEALREEALAQVPEERAAEARAEAHAAVHHETEMKDEEHQEAPQAQQAAPRDEAHSRGARGDPRNYPTYRPPRR